MLVAGGSGIVPASMEEIEKAIAETQAKMRLKLSKEVEDHFLLGYSAVRSSFESFVPNLLKVIITTDEASLVRSTHL